MKERVTQEEIKNKLSRKCQVLTMMLFLIMLSFTAAGQAKVWDRTYGGVITTFPEENIYTGENIRYGSASLSTIIPTPDGGYLLGGSSDSEIGGDKSQESRGANDYANVEEYEGPFYDDYWVVKIDGSGNKVWDKTFGGDGYDYLSAIVATPDGGYLLGGSSESGMSGNKSEAQRLGGYCQDGRCPLDYWVVKIDGSGNKVWDKSFGGGGYDYLSDIVVTPEGGFLLAGHSDSAVNGDKTQANHGMDDCPDGDCPRDYWVVKIDGSGNKMWDKTYGGDDYDGLSAIVAAPDGGYLLGGTSRSGISGDKSEASRGEGSDYWILKINDSGNKVWDKTFGSNDDYEGLSAIVVAPDGDYLLGGTSASGVSGDKSEASRGGSDYWVVRIGGSGNKIWDKTFGGSNDDRLSAIVADPDGGYLLGGSSSSPVSGDKSEPSSGGRENVDYWIVKVEDSGDKLWDKTLGGSDYDNFSAIVATPDESFLLGGTSRSGISGEKSEATKGFYDYWIVKVKDETNSYCVPSITNGCADENFIGYFAFAGIYYNAQGQGCQNNNSYTRFYPSYDIRSNSNYNATVKQGQSYSTTLRSYPEYGEVAQEQAFGVWIDYNNDKDFDDPGEFVYSSPEVGAEFTGTIMIPADAASGVRRLRVRSRPESVFTASESCAAGNYGETQDYTIAIGYCAPYALLGCGNGSYIDNFSFNTLVNNNSGCNGEGGYINYEPTGTLTTTAQKGKSYNISIQSGPVAQAFGVWIDYNNDLDFYDEGELVYASPIVGEDYEDGGDLISPSVSTDPYNGIVTIPVTAITGPVRMRVRSNSFPFYSGDGSCGSYDPDPPGLNSDSFLYGEIEDYTITIEGTALPPVFTSFSPNKGLPGTMVPLRGANLLTTSAVSFNGTEADFEVISDTEIQAFVPADASTGKITITTTVGEVTSGREFKVLQPSVYVFAPWRGYVGSKVIIVGEHLATASEVLFNSVPATDLIIYNDHLLRVTVPEGATTGRITVLLAGGGKAVSSFSYTVIQPTNRVEKKAVVLTTIETEQIVTYPNPFTEGVTISVNLQEEEPVNLEVYSTSGQKVRELNFGRLGAGQHELNWDGKDSYGQPVSRGLYLYKLTANGKIASGKLLKER